jgi:hypothetical protein
MPNAPRCEPTYAFEMSMTTILTALAASMFELKKRKIFAPEIQRQLNLKYLYKISVLKHQMYHQVCSLLQIKPD